jgi:hypothetical protein
VAPHRARTPGRHANVEQPAADLGPLSNAPASSAADAYGHESVTVIQSNKRRPGAESSSDNVSTSLHPVERKIRIWIIQQERNRQRERRQAASAAAAARSLSDTGALTRGAGSAGRR